MSPAADTRSRTRGANYDEPFDTVVNCSTMTDSFPHAKGTTLRRFKKENGAIYRIASSADLASLFALHESNPIVANLPTLNRKSSPPPSATIRPLRAVRRLLRTSETVTPPKTTHEHAVKSSASSPTTSSSKKPGTRKLQRSASSRVEDGAETDIAGITSRILRRFTILQAPFSQTMLARYALEDLNMNVRCYKRHVTTWDVPDHASFIFPAQLMITCSSINDFDPLAVPDVTDVDLVCTTVAINGPRKSHPQIAFRSFYDGATIRYVNDAPTADLSRGIHIENVPWCSTMDGDGNFGWHMYFWIPIPFALFQRVETKVFKIDAKVCINGEDGFLHASSDFTLSRLRRALVMT